MPQFTFKNLSVRLLPAGEQGLFCRDETTLIRLCSPCTDAPTCGPCSDFCSFTDPPVNWCRMVMTHPIVCGVDDPTGYQDEHTQIVIPASGDVRTDAIRLENLLRQQHAAVLALVEQLDAGTADAQQSGWDEEERLRSALLSAVQELDERRAAREGRAADGGSGAGPG